MSNPAKTIKEAILIVFKSRVYILTGVFSFLIFSLLYFFVLPATYTGGRIGWVSLRFLDLKLVTFSLLFSFALSLIVTFTLYTFLRHKGKKSSLAAGSFIGSILPSLFCCSPILPSFAALLGGIAPVAFRISGFLQGIIAVYETQIFIAVVVILAHSVYLNAKQVILTNSQLCNC